LTCGGELTTSTSIITGKFIKMSNTKPWTIFVTVGTTLFDDLIESVSDVSFLTSMYELEFRRIVIQFGKGVVPSFVATKAPLSSNNNDARMQGIYTLPSDAQKTLEWEIYRFKPSLEQDMRDAHWIISHAGAGSIMEGLSKCREVNNHSSQDPRCMKKLICVINDKLMHNHQTELAEALEKRGYLFVLSSPQQLVHEDTIHRMEQFNPIVFHGGDALAFPRLLDSYLGFDIK
jgi:UDP-N-acetylglucosamine transferase subunit ALG13